MATGLDRILSGSPYGFKDGLSSEDIDPDSVRQAILAIASGAALEPASGLAGLASLPFGVDTAANNVETIANLAYQPKETDILQYMGQALKPPVDWAKKNIGDIRRKAGDATLEATGSPGLASLAHSAPEALGLIAAGGMSIPAIKSMARAGNDQPDMSRRRAMVGVGGLAAATALAPKLVGKSLLDTGTASTTAKAVPTAAAMVAKAIPRATVSPMTMQMIQMMRAYPAMATAFRKGGKAGFEKQLHTDHDLLDEFEASGDDDNWNIIRRDTPEIMMDADSDWEGVNWDEVSKHLDNPDQTFDIRHNINSLDGEPLHSQDITRYLEDYPDGMTELDVHNTFTDLSDMDMDFQGFMSRRDYKQTLEDGIEYRHTDSKTKNVLNNMLKDDKAYDRYLNDINDKMIEYGIEYYF